MTVINNTILLVRRISDLQRRRDILVERQDRLRRALPEWTLAPLQLAGMSASEIRSMMGELDRAEADSGIAEVEQELEQLDQKVEELENQLLTTRSASFDSVQAVLALAVERFRNGTSTDPNDVFYDYGDARVLSFLEHVQADLEALLDENRQVA